MSMNIMSRMPLVKLETRKGLSRETKRAMLGAVHEALMAAFKIPDHDRAQRFVEHDPEDFEIPPGKGERFTILEITVFPGRSLDAKRTLYRDICSRFAELGTPAADIFIVLHEVPLDNWGMRGGKPGSEIDFGFKLDV
jgi:phenylpyruvate tautomerase PptA (4-oxalocrotonate tautomerase family)